MVGVSLKKKKEKKKEKKKKKKIKKKQYQEIREDNTDVEDKQRSK